MVRNIKSSVGSKYIRRQQNKNKNKKQEATLSKKTKGKRIKWFIFFLYLLVHNHRDLYLYILHLIIFIAVSLPNISQIVYFQVFAKPSVLFWFLMKHLQFICIYALVGNV